MLPPRRIKSKLACTIYTAISEMRLRSPKREKLFSRTIRSGLKPVFCNTRSATLKAASSSLIGINLWLGSALRKAPSGLL
jgi:hypothetical protein